MTAVVYTKAEIDQMLDEIPPSGSAGSAVVQKFKRGLSSAYHLYRGDVTVWTCLQQMRVDFTVSGPSTVEWIGKVNLKHRGVVNGPIGFGIRCTLRRADTAALLPTPPASSVDPTYFASSIPFVTWSGKAADNIGSLDQHYADAVFFGDEQIVAGAYRFEVWGNSHSSLAPTTDGLIEVNINGDGSDLTNPYSYLRLTVTT